MTPEQQQSSEDTAPGVAANAPTRSLVGQTIGQYELLRELGRGGMGTVYLALDTKLGRQVALKLLTRQFSDDAARVRRFRQEARAISTLNHPNILTIHEIGETQTDAGTLHFLATEYVEGQTLRAVLGQDGLTLGALLDIAMQAASALAAAHQAGIVHRDLKPENIMVRPDGLVKVLDFGLAKLTNTNPAAPATFSTVDTKPGVLMGTISYMSPEQARGLDVDARSDLFSFGVVLYELLTGRAPFAGATTGDVLVSILEREPPALHQQAPHVPAALQAIVNRALTKDRAQRYQRADELLGDMKELKQELELAARLKQPGDSPAGGVSLSLRVGEAAAGNGSAGAAVLSTQAARLPASQNRARPWRPAFQALALGTLALALAVAAWFVFWRGPRQAAAFDTVAVLPFININADPQTEYLPDGITEDLMQSLQQVPGLRVMARGTVFSYKGREIDPRQLGRELKVSVVVTGRVQRQGDRLLIAAELAETRDGTQVWSERYQIPLRDLPSMQAQLAHELTRKLRPQLAQPRATQSAVLNSEAYRLYLEGRYYQRQLTHESGEKALALFNQALALEPRFALPYSGIALVYEDFSSQYLTPRIAIAKARQAAQTALTLDDQLAEAHFAMAQIKVIEWDWAGAEQEFKRALTFNPDFIEARYYYAGALTRLKRFAEAEALFDRARELDPLSPQVCQGLANILYFSRQNERARVQAQKTLGLTQTGIWASTAHRVLGGIWLQQRRYDEALAEYRLGLEANPTESNKAWLAYAQARAGQPNAARATLRELQAAAKQHWVSPVYFARIHIALGEHDQAIAWLRQSYAAQSDHLVHLSVDPVYDDLRQDARFQELLRGIGLQP